MAMAAKRSKVVMDESTASAPIFYEPRFLSDPDAVFLTLMREVDWERRDAPRRECWMNPAGTPYTYGRGAGQRTYFPRPYHPLVARIASALREIDINVDACFLNRYDSQHEHLGWHADDSPEIDATRPIAVVSLGAERAIMVRRNGSNGIGSLTLANGSLFVMQPGMQATHQHKIPKHSAPCGARLSLTFRGLTPSAGAVQ